MIQNSPALTPNWSIGLDVQKSPFANFFAFGAFDFFDAGKGLAVCEFDLFLALETG